MNASLNGLSIDLCLLVSPGKTWQISSSHYYYYYILVFHEDQEFPESVSHIIGSDLQTILSSCFPQENLVEKLSWQD